MEGHATFCPRVAGTPPGSIGTLHHMFLARLLKGLIIAIATFVAGCLLAFGIYDLTEFQPHHVEIDAMLAAAHPLERKPPAILPRLQEANNGEWQTLNATRVVLWEIDSDRMRQSHTRRGIRELLWHALLQIHYSHAELLQIERSKIFLGNRAYGYAAGALSVFGRPLDQLDDTELARLVVIARSPSRIRQPDRVQMRESAAAVLLTRARAIETARSAR